ncbi:response regulator transcription factor [Paraflavitalea speifideaquila]|uniref:response regulator n=1 Tax=Paraflavitalea speifideaquila TaxID=3076558 RepID=UPI0028E20AF9|nr:response regulator transcription factor [Paraflavitalea speifideiaquila]
MEEIVYYSLFSQASSSNHQSDTHHERSKLSCPDCGRPCYCTLRNLFLIKELLPAGTVREAHTFDQALKLLDTNKFDLLVLDINIPGGNNLQMIDVIKLRQPDIKILIFSGYDEQVYALRYLQAGADGYVVKQAPETELKTAIQTLQNNDKYISHTVRQSLLDGLSTKNHFP